MKILSALSLFGPDHESISANQPSHKATASREAMAWQADRQDKTDGVGAQKNSRGARARNRNTCSHAPMARPSKTAHPPSRGFGVAGSAVATTAFVFISVYSWLLPPGLREYDETPRGFSIKKSGTLPDAQSLYNRRGQPTMRANSFPRFMATLGADGRKTTTKTNSTAKKLESSQK